MIIHKKVKLAPNFKKFVKDLPSDALLFIKVFKRLHGLIDSADVVLVLAASEDIELAEELEKSYYGCFAVGFFR